jgi:hypothetical protein
VGTCARRRSSSSKRRSTKRHARSCAPRLRPSPPPRSTGRSPKQRRCAPLCSAPLRSAPLCSAPLCSAVACNVRAGRTDRRQLRRTAPSSSASPPPPRCVSPRNRPAPSPSLPPPCSSRRSRTPSRPLAPPARRADRACALRHTARRGCCARGPMSRGQSAVQCLAACRRRRASCSSCGSTSSAPTGRSVGRSPLGGLRPCGGTRGSQPGPARPESPGRVGGCAINRSAAPLGRFRGRSVVFSSWHSHVLTEARGALYFVL